MSSDRIDRDHRGMTTIDESQRTAAKVAGAVYLLGNAAAFFSQAYVPAKLIEVGDAAATARNIMGSELLFRIAVASDIVIFACDAVLAVAFYVLLRRVSPSLAMLGLLWRATQVAISGMAAMSYLTALSVLRPPTAGAGGPTAPIGGDLRAFTTEQRQALASAFLSEHTAQFYIGLVFLGLGSAVFCYVLFKSRYVPRPLAALGVLGYAVLAVGTLAVIIFPGAEDVTTIVAGRYVPVFFFEVIAGAWLLSKGVRAPAAAAPATARG